MGDKEQHYTMSIQRRPAKGKPAGGGKPKWIVRYRDPSGRERSTTFTNRAEAVAYDEEQSRLLRRSEWIDEDNAPLLKDIWKQWQDAATNPGTRYIRELLGKNLGDLANTRITKIKPTQLRTWQAHIQGGRPWVPGCTGVAPNTALSWWTQLSGCLHMAVIDEQLLANPCSKVQGPKSGVEPVDPRTLPTLSQVREAVDRADNTGRNTLGTMILLAVGTGMRPAEVAGLRWCNVERDEKTLHVVEQARLRRNPGDSPWGPPKTKKSRRVVPVPPAVMVRLLQHRLRHPSDPEKEPVFSTHNGRMWNSDLFAKSVSALVGDQRWTPHSLRHVYASSLIRQGLGVKAVQSMLGHASAATTLDTYSHMWPDEPALVREAAEGLVRDICGMDNLKLINEV